LKIQIYINKIKDKININNNKNLNKNQLIIIQH